MKTQDASSQTVDSKRHRQWITSRPAHPSPNRADMKGAVRLAVLICGALCLARVSAYASHATQTGTGRQQGELRYYGTNVAGTWTAAATAIAPGAADADSKSGAKPASGSVGTRNVTASGSGANASAAGNLNFKLSKGPFFTLLVSPRGSFASVNDPNNVGASASYNAGDPAYFYRRPGGLDVYDGDFTLEPGFDIQAAGNGAEASYNFTMDSNHPDYGFLFSFGIDMKGWGRIP